MNNARAMGHHDPYRYNAERPRAIESKACYYFSLLASSQLIF